MACKEGGVCYGELDGRDAFGDNFRLEFGFVAVFLFVRSDDKISSLRLVVVFWIFGCFALHVVKLLLDERE